MPARFLIRDRGAQFPAAFDTVVAAEGVEVSRTPYDAPNAHAYAERWIRSVREECLDHLLVASAAPLRRVLIEDADYFHHARPHQGLAQRGPIAPTMLAQDRPVYHRERLGGLLHDDFREAA